MVSALIPSIFHNDIPSDPMGVLACTPRLFAPKKSPQKLQGLDIFAYADWSFQRSINHPNALAHGHFINQHKPWRVILVNADILLLHRIVQLFIRIHHFPNIILQGSLIAPFCHLAVIRGVVMQLANNIGKSL